MKPRVLLPIAILTACAAPEDRPIDGVPLYTEWPMCQYEKLGPVVASDGHKGHPEGAVWPIQGRESVVRARLQHQALALGANAVILTSRVVSQRESDHGSLAQRPARYIKMIGIAIRDCRSGDMES